MPARRVALIVAVALFLQMLDGAIIATTGPLQVLNIKGEVVAIVKTKSTGENPDDIYLIDRKGFREKKVLVNPNPFAIWSIAFSPDG